MSKEVKISSAKIKAFKKLINQSLDLCIPKKKISKKNKSLPAPSVPPIQLNNSPVQSIKVNNE